MKNYVYNFGDLSRFNDLNSIFKNKGGIYLWINTVNKKSYVGSTNDLARRIKEYLNQNRLKMELDRGESMIYKAMLKYGYDAFTLEILESIEIKDFKTRKEVTEILNKLEQKYIIKLQPEYNILKLAGSNRGHKMSEETRNKMSMAKKGVQSNRKGTLTSDFTRKLMQDNSAIKKKVYMYSFDYKLIKTFDSIKKCAEAIIISRDRVSRSIDKNKLVENKYYFFSKPIPRK